MASAKVTLFQKHINRPVSNEQKSKLSKEKSDFLLLPEFFPFYDLYSSPENLSDKSKILSDELLQISEYYKGIIIGGSMFRKDSSGVLRIGVPIVQDLMVVDWYDKRELFPKKILLLLEIQKRFLLWEVFVLGSWLEKKFKIHNV